MPWVVSSSGNLSFTQWRGLCCARCKEGTPYPSSASDASDFLAQSTDEGDLSSFYAKVWLLFFPKWHSSQPRSFLGGLFHKVLRIVVLLHGLSDSFPNSSSLLDTMVALWTRQSMTPDFTDVGWWDVNCTYRLVCVGLQYTWRTTCPYSSAENLISVNGSDPSLSSSMVNLICPCCTLRYSRSSCPVFPFTTEMMSFTYRFHTLGAMSSLAPARAFSSRSAMKMSAITGDSGDPMATPSSCWYGLPPKKKWCVWEAKAKWDRNVLQIYERCDWRAGIFWKNLFCILIPQVR